MEVHDKSIASIRSDDRRVANRLVVPLHKKINDFTSWRKIIDAACDAGVFWNSKLSRGTLDALKVPGIIVTDSIEPGELLCRVPAHLHLSSMTCRLAMPQLFEACEALPSKSSEKRAEAAHVACVALLLKAAVDCVELPVLQKVPALWRFCADALVGLDFSTHPYFQSIHDTDNFFNLIAPSAEAEHVLALVKYIFTVFDSINGTVSVDMVGNGFDVDYFFQAWLCLLTRSVGCPSGSALVPVIDFFNHSTDPVADMDWDDGIDAVIVRAKRRLCSGEEVFITYGTLSNALLYRTYGFTLGPQVETCHTYTFETSVLQEMIDKKSIVAEVAEVLIALPNLHIDSSCVTESLVAFLKACADGHVDAGALLYELCSCRAKLYEQDVSMKVAMNALKQVRRSDRSSMAWWTQMSLSQITAGLRNFLYVKMSEYTCLVTHLEALDFVAGKLLEEEVMFQATELCQDLYVLKNAGFLGLPQREVHKGE